MHVAQEVKKMRSKRLWGLRCGQAGGGSDSWGHDCDDDDDDDVWLPLLLLLLSPLLLLLSLLFFVRSS